MRRTELHDRPKEMERWPRTDFIKRIEVTKARAHLRDYSFSGHAKDSIVVCQMRDYPLQAALRRTIQRHLPIALSHSIITSSGFLVIL
jgi:hypothetical protein